VTAAAVQAREHSPIDITSHDFWSQPFAVRDETFAQLRRGGGLTWHRPFASMFPMEEPGYWALTRRADIACVSQHPEMFTSAQGVALDPMPAEIQRFASFFLSMDPPQHTVYRRLSARRSRRETSARSRTRSIGMPLASWTISLMPAMSTSSPPVRRGCRC
jgi:cytochrome P450